MRILDKLLPPPRLLDSPSEELAELGLRQVRAENGFAVHLAVWLTVSAFLFFFNLLVVPEEPASLGAILPWGVFVFFHGRRVRVGRRRAYERKHRELHQQLRRQTAANAQATGVGLLRQKLLKTAEQARAALRTVSPGTVAEVSRGETEALAMVAWLDEAEELIERHRGDPKLRRKVARELSDPRSGTAREPLEELLTALDRHDARVAILEREASERRARVESFLLALENVKFAHSGGGIVPALSASVSQSVALLGEGEEAAGDSTWEIETRILEEVRLAQELQSSILPGGAPEVAGLDVAYVYRPSSEVGGDFYDFYMPSQEKLLVAVGDATGHGLDSSMVSSMAKSALYMQMSARRELAHSMSEINRMMCDTLGRRRFMTLALVEIDVGARRLAWVNAGQVYPLLVRAGEILELEQPGYPLGVRREVSYEVRRQSLEPGDLLLLLTDGYIEAANDAGEPQGWDRLIECLRRGDTGDPEGLLDTLSADLASHLGAAQPQDDVTLIAIGFAP